MFSRLLMFTPFAAMAGSATITPRIDIYTTLACSFIRPEYGDGLQQQLDILGGFLHSNDCSSSYRIPAAAVAHQSSCMNISDVIIFDKSFQTNGPDTPPTRKQRCASDPVVQAAVAKLTSRAYRIASILFFWYFLHGHALCHQAAGTSCLIIMLDDDTFKFFTMTDPHFIFSHHDVHGNSYLPYNWLVGCCKPDIISGQTN